MLAKHTFIFKNLSVRIFYIKPKYEIGFYEDGKIYIHDDFIYLNNACLALTNLNE